MSWAIISPLPCGQSLGWQGPQLMGPLLTPVREVLVIAVFLPRRQWVQVVTTAAVLDHVVLEARVETSLGVGKGTQTWLVMSPCRGPEEEAQRS
jgi:hypothetical protein